MALMQTGFVLILLGATLSPVARARAVGTLAAVAAGLAIAGLAAAPTPGPDGLPAGFAAADTALLGLGGLLALIAAVMGWRGAESAAAKAAVIAQAAGTGALGLGGASLLAQTSPGTTLVALLMVLTIGLLLLLPGRFVRPAAVEPALSRPVAGTVGLAIGAVAVAVGPHLSVVILGAVLAGWSGYLVQRGAGGPRIPTAAALTLILLPAWWLMATIAGPEGLRMTALAELPLSPAAERLLAPALLLGAWALSGLWPLHRQMPAAFTAPVAALLLARVALPAVPEGLEDWRALAMPVVVAGTWHAALTGRMSRLAVGLAWVGLLAPDGEGLAGAGLLLAAALLAELDGPIARVTGRPVSGTRVAMGLAAGAGGLLAVTAGLHGEVVYTVLAVAAVVAAVGRAFAAQASTASEPRTTAPRV